MTQFNQRTLAELAERLTRLEQSNRQLVGSGDTMLWQGEGNNLALTTPNRPRKIVRITAQQFGPVYSSDPGQSYLGDFYTYSWLEVEHDRVNGFFYDAVGGMSGYFNLRDLNNNVLPDNAIVEIFTQEGYDGSWWYTHQGEAPSYASGYESSNCCDLCNRVGKVLHGACIDTHGKITQNFCYVCWPSGEVLGCACEEVSDCSFIGCEYPAVFACPCGPTGTDPKFWCLTFSTSIGSANCTWPSSTYWQKFCLDGISFASNPCFYEWPTATGAGAAIIYLPLTCPSGPYGAGAMSAVWWALVVNQDGSATLTFSLSTQLEPEAVYHIAAWNCTATTNRMLLVTSGGLFAWPSQAILTRGNDCSGCADGGGGVITNPTACCPGGLPNVLTLTITGAGCSLNGTYTLINVGAPSWQWTGPIAGGETQFTMFCSGSTMVLQIQCISGTGLSSANVAGGSTCSPVHLVFNMTVGVSTCCPAGTTFTGTVTG